MVYAHHKYHSKVRKLVLLEPFISSFHQLNIINSGLQLYKFKDEYVHVHIATYFKED